MEDIIHDWVNSLNVNNNNKEKITLFVVYSLYNTTCDEDFDTLKNILSNDNIYDISDTMDYALDKRDEILKNKSRYSRSESPEREINYKPEYIFFAYIILCIALLYYK